MFTVKVYWFTDDAENETAEIHGVYTSEAKAKEIALELYRKGAYDAWIEDVSGKRM